MPSLTRVESEVADLYGDLWPGYDDALYEESVALFAKRFAANGFDLEWFRGKTCLDAGCGGGRYSIAMGRLGAAKVVGVDISSTGIADARRRAAGMPNVSFQEASVLDLPFPDASFDFVCSSGVLHHTLNPEQGLREVCRVLKPGGRLYLLMYATGGIRWPLFYALRAIVRDVGVAATDRAVRLAGLKANKRRMFLDDLFVPLIDLFSWERLERLMRENGLTEITRWRQGQLDHEQDLRALRGDLEPLADVFRGAAASADAEIAPHRGLFAAGSAWCEAALRTLEHYERRVAEAAMSESDAITSIIGQANHRVLAVKPAR